MNLSGGCTCEVPKLVRVPGTSCNSGIIHAIQAIQAAFEIRSSPRNLKCWGQMCCADGRPGHRDAPRRTETHRDADRFWLCCKICKALSFSFEEHQVLEGEGSGLPPEGHWNFQECSWFMGSSLVIRKLNHRYHRHFMAFLTIKSITGTRHSISVETCAVVVVIVPLAAHRLASGTYRAPLRRNPDMAETQRLGEIRMDPMNIHC